jgi:hypothetical protein
VRAEDSHRPTAPALIRRHGCGLAALVLTLGLLSGITEARTLVRGRIAQDTVWAADRAPYVLVGTVEIAPDAALEIKPRGAVHFQPGARLIVGGRLVAERMAFDGREDLANREMIVFSTGSTGYLRHCIVENLELRLETSDVAVTDNLIANRNGNGVTVTRQAAPFIARNDFQHNSYFAVYKAGRRRLNAPDNYWGAADGPGGAGPGRGDAVNDHVDFRPFAATANGEHVLLKGTRLAPRECRPGERLNLEYTLVNFNAFGHDLILGASLYREDQQAVHNAAGDLKVHLDPGWNTFQRPFQIPDHLPAGRYDILWGVMKSDLSTYLAIKREDGALTVTPPPKRPGGTLR